MILTILGFIAGLVAIVSLLFRGPKCPECGGKMFHVGTDYHYNIEIYRCRKCGEEWV